MSETRSPPIPTLRNQKNRNIEPIESPPIPTHRKKVQNSFEVEEDDSEVISRGPSRIKRGKHENINEKESFTQSTKNNIRKPANRSFELSDDEDNAVRKPKKITNRNDHSIYDEEAPHSPPIPALRKQNNSSFENEEKPLPAKSSSKMKLSTPKKGETNEFGSDDDQSERRSIINSSPKIIQKSSPAIRPRNNECDFDDAPISNKGGNNQGEYDLSNLPPEAFIGGEIQAEDTKEEEVIVPKLLSLKLGKVKNVKDTEPDNCQESLMPKEQAQKDFVQYIEPQVIKQLESKQQKQRLKGMNSIQTKLEESVYLDSYAEMLFRGLEKYPGWKETNISINQVQIDIIRHIIVKSQDIKKPIICIVFPFLASKLTEKKLKSMIEELFLIISEMICPSFVLTQLINQIMLQKNPKIIVSSLEVSIEVLKLFGPGEIAIIEYLPHLKSLLQHSNPDVKTMSTTIATYLFRSFGNNISEFLSDLPKPIFERITKEFETVSSLPQATKLFFRHKSDSGNDALEKLIENAPRNKITKYITPEQMEAGQNAKKWAEQKDFFEQIENGLKECKDRIVSSDLDPIIKVLKGYLVDGNKNLGFRALVLIERLCMSSDKEFSRFVPQLSTNIVSNWAESRQNNREQTTKTINALCTVSSPVPFVKALSKMYTKLSSDMKTDVIKWVQQFSTHFTPGDFEKLAPFVIQCCIDRISGVRQTAMAIALLLKDICPEAFDSSFKNLPASVQRDLSIQFDNMKGISSKLPFKADIIDSPSKNSQKVIKPIAPTENIVSESDTLRFSSQPTAQKKQKRLKAIQPRFALSIASNKSLLSAAVEKCKIDAQSVLPALISSRMFSNQANDQIDAIQDFKATFNGNEQSYFQCSDIFIRWVSIKLIEKNYKVFQEGISILLMLFNNYNFISIQEIDVIIPTIFIFIDIKTFSNVDIVLDLVFEIRVHSDPLEYSSILRSCLETCPNQWLAHLFSELQYTVVDGIHKTELFFEILPFVDTKDIDVSAACGGVLSLIYNSMVEEEKQGIQESLNDAQIESIYPFIPVFIDDFVQFEEYNDFSQIEKSKSIKQLISQMEKNPQSIHNHASVITITLSKELIGADINVQTIKTVLYTLHELFSRYTITLNGQKALIKSVLYFSNKMQHKLPLLDGIPQMINSILFKAFEKVSPINVYSSCLESMDSYAGDIGNESFYSKCWVAYTSRLLDITEESERGPILDFIRNIQINHYSQNDIRPKLINSVITVITKKISPTVLFSPVKKPQIAESTSQVESRVTIRASPKKDPTIAPVFSSPKTSVFIDFDEPEKPSAPIPAEPVPVPKSNESKQPTPKRGELRPKKSPIRSAFESQSEKPNSKQIDVLTIKERLSQLKKRWG